MEVPTKTSLADVYPEDAIQSQTKRWNTLIETFKETYGRLPDFVSRSPGRVNIIGEVLTISRMHGDIMANICLSISTTRSMKSYQWL
jgi:hypothetical protein